MKFPFVAALAMLLCAGAASRAQTVTNISVRVMEPAGIRRTSFPVNARVPFPKGALQDVAQARLLFDGKEVPAQYSVEARWPDGSVQWLDVDYNASIGPLETQTYLVEYGPGTLSPQQEYGPGKVLPRALGLLSVSENADTIQVGNVRFSKSGSPLILSVKYRGEDIGHGVNGLFVTDDAGHAHDLSAVESLKTEIVKDGPFYVVIRYSGKLIIDSGYGAPFVLTVAMPNSKTMVSVSAFVEDPLKRLREISFGTPLAFGPLPWVWDFGTNRWTYGSFRNATDSVTLTQTSGAWSAITGPKGKEQLYETSGTNRTELVRWGHIQDGKEVVAFGVDIGSQAGTSRFTLDGDGQALFRYAPSAPATKHELTVFEHFVTTPVQIGAATSPSALLSPLVVTIP